MADLTHTCKACGNPCERIATLGHIDVWTCRDPGCDMNRVLVAHLPGDRYGIRP